ncbi:hypothetical protein FQN57_003095 [Myotisia sp. PD_48]|nr:hypothetical protein FQN57_003095 [Myotisia sp. PD_48]
MTYEFGGISASPEIASYQFPLTQQYEGSSDSSSSGAYDMRQMMITPISTSFGVLPFDSTQIPFYPPVEKIPVEYIDSTTLDEGDRRRRRSSQSKEAVTTMHLRRRAQNRASQRAFRERKEKHVKGLESQLQDLHQDHQKLLRSYNLQTDEVRRLKDRIRDLLADMETLRAPPQLQCSTPSSAASACPSASNTPVNVSALGITNASPDFRTINKFEMIPFSGAAYPTPEPFYDKSLSIAGTVQ